MDKLTVPSPSNGFPFNWEDLEFALGLGSYSKGIIQAIEGILAAYGDDIIVSGCEVSAPDITEGWVLISGTLVKVNAHTTSGNYFEINTTYNSDGNKQTQLGGIEDSYQQNRATASASSGTLENPVTGNPARLGSDFTLNLIRNDSDFEADETNKGVVRISDQATARAGTNNTEAITALRMLDALQNGGVYASTETNKGVVEKATLAEAHAGASERYIDAALLQLVTATETRKGVVEKATLAEVQAGTADKFIDAELLAETFNRKKIRIVSIPGVISFASDENTIITTLSSGVSFTLPTASSNNEREIRLINQAPGTITVSSYINISGSAVTTITTDTAITLHSDGVNWYQVA